MLTNGPMAIGIHCAACWYGFRALELYICRQSGSFYRIYQTLARHLLLYNLVLILEPCYKHRDVVLLGHMDGGWRWKKACKSLGGGGRGLSFVFTFVRRNLFH